MGQWFSLATPLSFRQPVLPPRFRFAVVDTDGSVLYHSDPTRSLKQNFFEETENNPALRAAALGRHDDLVTGNYEGRRHRFQITPIDAERSTQARRWSLIVFQDTSVPETVNLEVLTLGVFVFLVYSGILAAVWGGAYFLWAGYPQKWFWPDDSSDVTYRKIVVVNVLLLTVSLAWALFFESRMLIVVGPVVFAFTGLGTTFWMLTRNREREATSGNVPPGWRQSFYLARISLITILAVAPALACFRAAYEFETRLLIKSGQASLAHQLEERNGRNADEAEKLPFCEKDKNCPSDESLKRKRTFTDKRSKLAWDIYVDPFFGTCRGDVKEAPCDRVAADWRAQDGSLDRVFGVIHRSYNDVAVDLRAAIRDRGDAPAFLKSDPSPTTALPGTGYWFYFALALVVLYALVRHTASRLFVIDLYDPPAADVVPKSNEGRNVLLIGPQGSRKTQTLSEREFLQVIDIRIKVLEERRERARPVAGDRTAMLHIAALALGVPFQESPEPQSGRPPRSPQAGSWVEAIHPEGAVGFDHFEHGFDDPGFRDQMLSVLEDLIYRQRRVVWIASTREPWRRVQVQSEPHGNGSSLPDRDRWVRVFESFQKVNMSFKEDGAPREPYYQLLWAGCSREEQLALRQLVEENIVNPNNESVLRRLIQDGLMFRGPSRGPSSSDRMPIFRIVNEKFGQFILHAQSSSTIAEWEREGVVLSWATIRTTLVTVAVGIVGLLLLTQQQLVEAWVGYIPMLAPAIPTALKVLGSFQRDVKSDVLST